MNNSNAIFLLILALVSPFAWSSQGLLDCQGPKVKFEIWFDEQPTPQEAYVYEIDPAYGTPAQYSVALFQMSSSKIDMTLLAPNSDYPNLELHLTYSSFQQGYSGALFVAYKDHRLIFPDHLCQFR